MWYGLSLDPPDNAAAFSFDEKSSVQALDRTHPGLPLKKVRCGTMTHDYKRHGTTSERRLVRAQATCPHCEMRATGAREFVVTGRVVSPPGTIRAQCTMCGKVFGCLRDGAEEAERRFGRIAEEAGMDLATWKARGLD